MAYVEVEHELDVLLEEFGPPRKTSPGYPFHYLVSDGLWIVRTPGGAGSPGSNRGALRVAGAVGELEPEFARDLERSPGTFRRGRESNSRCELPTHIAPGHLGFSRHHPCPGRAGRTRRRRSPCETARSLIFANLCFSPTNTAARCVAMTASLGGRLWESTPVTSAGGPRTDPIDVSNGIALCSLHHKLFDRGALGLTAGHRVAVSTHFLGRSPAAEDLVLSLVDRPLLPAQPGQSLPAARHVAWHVAQVFRAPARKASQPQPA